MAGRVTSSSVWLAFLLLLGGSLYWPGRHAAYFGDDFQWYFDPAPGSIFHYFTHANEHIRNAYRPLQAAFLIAVQQRFGLETLPIHVIQVLLHVLLSWLIFTWMRTHGFRAVQSYLGSLLMLISQANVMAVNSNDTLSQVLGTLFGCVSVGLFFRSLGGSAAEPALRSSPEPRDLALSVLLFGLALLAKETSTSFFLMVAILLAAWRTADPLSRRVRRGLVVITPYLVLLLCYLWIRARLGVQGPSTHGERYGFEVWNVPKNVILFGAQALLPVSSVLVFRAAQFRAMPTLVGVGFAWVAIAVGTVVGLRRAGASRLVGLVGVCALFGLFPVVLLNKVSELYLYNSMPFVSILVAVGLGTLVANQSANRRSAMVGLLLLAAFGVSQVRAVRSKVLMMKARGDQSTVLLTRIGPYLRDIPDHGLLLLLNPDSDEVEYSVFVLSGFNVLDTGLDRLYALAERRDFQISVRPRAALDDMTTRRPHCWH